MKRIITSFIVMLAALTAAQAQIYTVDTSRTSGVRYHISNYGIFGHNVAQSDPGFVYPRGSDHSYVFGSGLWFGAQRRMNDTLRKLVFVTYDPNSGGSWATPGNVDTTNRDGHLYYSGDFNRSTGTNIGADTGAIWPLWLEPGGATVTTAPGIYEPVIANRNRTRYAQPSFMPIVDEQFVTRYHDNDLDRYAGFGEEFGFPIGLQIQQNVYSWQGGLFESAVVLQYEVVNVSGDTLIDCLIGQATDPDLGIAANDHVKAYRSRGGTVRTGVAYTDVEAGGSYGALAQILLEGPSTDDAGFIDNSRRIREIPNHEIRTFQDWELLNDPVTNVDRYDFMRGPERDEFPEPGDKRTLLAGKMFSMMPGDTVHFTLAFAVVRSPFGLANDKGAPAVQLAGNPWVGDIDDLIFKLVDDYQTGVYYGVFPTSVDESISDALSAHPNPTAALTSIDFEVASQAEVEVSVINSMGELVMTKSIGRLDAGTHRTTLDLSRFASGAYIVVVDAGDVRRTSRIVVTH